MPISWQSAGSGCKIGVDWQGGDNATQCWFTIKVYRHDNSSTMNNGCDFTEELKYEPSGSTGSWTVSMPSSSHSGDYVIDTFAKRTYNKTASVQTVTLKITCDSNFGTWSGGWVPLGSQTFTFTFNIPALQSYSVTYNGNGSTSGSTAAQTKYAGASLTLRSNGFAKTGHTFKNWNTAANGSGTSYSAGASYTANAAATLYAQWKANTYAVTYNANQGTGAPASQVKTYGQALTLSSTKPTRAGYEFASWNTAQDGSGTAYASGGTVAANTNSALTLYAQWRPSITITSLTAIRCDSSGNQDNEGLYCNITCVWQNPSGQTATVSGTIQANVSGSTGTALTLSTTSSGTTNTTIASTRPSVDTDKSYTVTINITVSGTVVATKSVTLTKSAFVLDFASGGLGMGIGTAAPSSGLEVGWPTTFAGTAIHNGCWSEFKSANLDRDGSNPSSDTYGDARIRFRDKDGEVLGLLGVGMLSDGTAINQVGVYNEKTDGTEVYNFITVRVKKDGTQSYSVSAPANFRAAIGINKTTGNLSALGVALTWESGVSATSSGGVRYGDYVCVQVSIKFSAAKTAGTQFKLFSACNLYPAVISCDHGSGHVNNGQNGWFVPAMAIAANASIDLVISGILR